MNSSVPNVLGSSACQASSTRRGRLFGRTDPVDPVVVADEVAARPAQQRHLQAARAVQDVGAEAVLVAQRRARLEDPAVDAPPEVLDEPAEDAPIDRAERAVEFECDSRHGEVMLCDWCAVAAQRRDPPGHQANHDQTRHAATDHGEHRAGQRRDHARLEGAELVRGADEDGFDRRHPAAQGVWSSQLNRVLAHDHAHLIGHADQRVRRHRQRQRASTRRTGSSPARRRPPTVSRSRPALVGGGRTIRITAISNVPASSEADRMP